MNSFVKQFIAYVKGDDAEVLAQQTHRKAVAALNSQISEFEGDLVDLEERLMTAKEALDTARINDGKAIKNRNDYSSRLVAAKNEILNCEDAIVEHKKTLEFFKSELQRLKS